MISKMGGPIVLYIGILILLFILKVMGFNTAVLIITILYFLLFVYSWVIPVLYRVIQKRRKI